MLPRYTISQITIYNFTNHDIQFHISRYITCRDIQCAHLSKNNVSALKTIMKKIQEKKQKIFHAGFKLLTSRKKTKTFYTGLEPLTFTFRNIHLTVCAISTNIHMPRISSDFILKWPNCHIDRLCISTSYCIANLISRYIAISWQH